MSYTDIEGIKGKEVCSKEVYCATTRSTPGGSADKHDLIMIVDDFNDGTIMMYNAETIITLKHPPLQGADDP